MAVASEDAEEQWDLLCTHHTGKWHGLWTTTFFGPKNEIKETKEMSAVTDVTISEDGTVCTVSRQVTQQPSNLPTYPITLLAADDTLSLLRTYYVELRERGADW